MDTVAAAGSVSGFEYQSLNSQNQGVSSRTGEMAMQLLDGAMQSAEQIHSQAPQPAGSLGNNIDTTA